MMNLDKKFAPFAQMMTKAGLPPLAISNFQYYFHQAISQKTEDAFIRESVISPVNFVPESSDLEPRLQDYGRQCLAQSIVIKLNGGLGTSMGLQKAKSLLPVKNGLSFLEIIIQQTLHQKNRLLLMNSFHTHAESLEVLLRYSDLKSDLPSDLVQHKIPKILQKNFTPATSPNPTLNWCPPGHGNIFVSMYSSGLLKLLLAKNYRYAFISNSDNLGAVMDPLILGYFAKEEIPCLAEVAQRTEMDQKGGHLARRKDGLLIFREVAQCHPDDLTTFQDIKRYPYFNTNNLWINLPALQKLLDQNQGVLKLPLIRNYKHLDPCDPESPPVLQLETAMSCIIEHFPGSRAILVPRTRFLPVKTTDELLIVGSDLFQLTDDFLLSPVAGRNPGDISVQLDPQYFRRIDDFNQRFAEGLPSLKDCTRLEVSGDVRFSRSVRIVGKVSIRNLRSQPLVIGPDRIIKHDLIINE
jgi:UTP--glucose-1-phosphate uridylyltransferase